MPKIILFEGITIKVVQKKIKHIYLYVKPPYGEVELRTPLMMNDNMIHSFLISKKEWIQQKQDQIQSRPKPIEYKYVNDEVHYYNGKSYQLKIVETTKKQHVVISDDTITLMMKKNHTAKSRENVLELWYKQQFKNQIQDYVTYWEPIMNVKVNDIGIKKMKTKWGTCNITTQKIWLSLMLAKKSPQCVEYVVVHEMVHLLERYHNQRFKGFMTQFLPEWKQLKKQLHQ